MAGEAEAVQAVRIAHQRPVGGVAALTNGQRDVVKRALRAALDARDAERAAANKWLPYAAGFDGDVLRKRAREARATAQREAHALDVALARAALADAQARVDWLADVYKAGGWREDGRLREATQLAEALATPAPRADLFAGTNPTRAEPHAQSPQLTTATTGAAALAGGNPDEFAAALKAGDEHWLTRLHEQHHVLDAVKAARARPIRCGSAPPRFK